MTVWGGRQSVGVQRTVLPMDPVSVGTALRGRLGVGHGAPYSCTLVTQAKAPGSRKPAAGGHLCTRKNLGSEVWTEGATPL